MYLDSNKLTVYMPIVHQIPDELDIVERYFRRCDCYWVYRLGGSSTSLLCMDSVGYDHGHGVVHLVFK